MTAVYPTKFAHSYSVVTEPPRPFDNNRSVLTSATDMRHYRSLCIAYGRFGRQLIGGLEVTDTNSSLGSVPARLTTELQYGTSPNTSRPASPPGRIDISVDDENYEAGSGNIIVITLRNPFDVPIEIIELKDPRSTSIRSTRRVISKSIESRTKLLDALNGWFGGFGSAMTASIGFGGIKAQFGTPARKLEINAARDSTIDIGQVVSQFDTIVVNAARDATLLAAPPPEGEIPVRTLQPHCETNAFLTIDTKGWLFAKPTRLRLKSELRYRIDGEPTEYTQVVPLNFDVRPPLRSVVIGSLCGALLGGAARFINDVVTAKQNIFELRPQDLVLQTVKICGSIIMSIIATIALSRKTGAQGFITVEDFFGGFVIGVLISYEGTSYFEDVLKNSRTK